jgi:hypothetical protein
MSGDEEIMEVDSSPGDENSPEETKEKKITISKEPPSKPQAASLSGAKRNNVPW